ncbi:hypothetical protein B0I35DRAFT_452332 [Stachybotrys elegans]|uniref:Uncharacterized protein n=1 Tax=Stachybotrys elegans TaxID=80388 RepID=A0A8K0WP14_9HYPO|nr:hypothetical protein B0I35DRAFT_452332 [Stachybotrys elegans]
MHTVPSLVGTGTAIAAAATGLVFAQPSDSESYPSRPETPEQRIFQDQEPVRHSRLGNSPRPSPFTNSARRPVYRAVSRPPLSRYQRPRSSHYTHSQPNAGSRPQSSVRHGDSPILAEPSRDSISSNSSWIRRLSIRPLSQHGSGSPRSSVGPDSPSIAFSYGSGAPILPSSGTAAPPLPPNKLVKRTPSDQARDSVYATRPRTRSHLPALRRPATSHQRSATLQQQQLHAGFDAVVALETAPPPTAVSQSQSCQPFNSAPNQNYQATRATPRWVSYIHSKTSSSTVRHTAGRLGEFTPQSRNIPRRLSLSGGGKHTIHLVPASMVTESSAVPDQAPKGSISQDVARPVEDRESRPKSPEQTPSRQAKRSMSMTFSAAGSWVSRTSGSIRRPKRGPDPISGSKRIVSDPVSTVHPAVEPSSSATSELPVPPLRLKTQGSAIDFSTATATPRQRNISSPLPVLTRLSSFHVDLSRLGSSGGATTNSVRPNQSSGSSSSSTTMSHFRAPQNDKPPAPVDNTDVESRAFLSGDDDDTDCKSDTMFDSLRTVASGRVRTVETPLDSMYDDSPPSTAGNGRSKRLSIQEMLAKAWEGDNRIMEEDESFPTPIHPHGHTDAADSRAPRFTGGRFSIESSTDGHVPVVADFNRIDDDAPYNALSAPSRGSPSNPKGINPNVRLALANISGNGTPEVGSHDSHHERPVSHLFDWSGKSPRPKTAYGKQETDTRGGRASMRKGPTPMHVRSQSVPVYGTWGLGTKTISGNENDDKTQSNVFAVPESIQATQPSLSLLVNDLKRLCRHARDLDLLEGPQKVLWKEAEGIIALASPDEDSLDVDVPSASPTQDPLDVSERFLEDAFDATSIDRFDAVFDGAEPVISKTAVVRERHSPRRRSVFSPDDDIFGNWPLPDESTTPSNRQSRPRTPENRPGKAQDVTVVVRSVMEAVQRTSAPGPAQPTGFSKSNRMHFDTNSLKALVRRAGELRDSLSDTIRRADQITQSPARTPRHERNIESSPAFTKVFEDPGSSPPRRGIRSRGTTPLRDTTSPGNSPSSSLSRRVHIMRVS